MTATLVATKPHTGRLTRLPLSSLTQRGSEPAVWVLGASGDRLELRPVTVAKYAGDQVIVASGLMDGEKVVTAGVHKLDAQQKVRVWTEPER